MQRKKSPVKSLDDLPCITTERRLSLTLRNATATLDVARSDAVVRLALVLVVTMTLPDLMNNAATATVMCPIAIGAATQLGASADAFLMAVAIGASCAVQTPIVTRTTR